jgi:hypothetical protein
MAKHTNTSNTRTLRMLGQPNIVRLLISTPQPEPILMPTIHKTTGYKEMIRGGEIEIPYSTWATALQENTLEISCYGTQENQKNARYSWHIRSTTKLLEGIGPLLTKTNKRRARLHSILAALYIVQQIETSTAATGSVW